MNRSDSLCVMTWQGPILVSSSLLPDTIEETTRIYPNVPTYSTQASPVCTSAPSMDSEMLSPPAVLSPRSLMLPSDVAGHDVDGDIWDGSILEQLQQPYMASSRPDNHIPVRRPPAETYTARVPSDAQTFGTNLDPAEAAPLPPYMSRHSVNMRNIILNNTTTENSTVSSSGSNNHNKKRSIDDVEPERSFELRRDARQLGDLWKRRRLSDSGSHSGISMRM